LQLDGRGASYSNIYSVTFTSGYFFIPSWWVEAANGIPMWTSLTINGSSPPWPPSGTVLPKVLSVATPLTGVYHFIGLAGFQPYLGASRAGSTSCSISIGASSSTPSSASRSRQATGTGSI
jgi:outer membrane protein W